MDVPSEVVWLRILIQIHREQEALRLKHPDFDTWYRARVNVAHAKYIERTSYRLRCDWRVFPPVASEAYLNGPGL